MSNEANNASPAPISIREFFESHPPGSQVVVRAAMTWSPSLQNWIRVSLPEIMLHCPQETCQGPRLHQAQGEWTAKPETIDNEFVRYACRNCGKSVKTFAVRGVFGERPDISLTMQKFGEVPPFGPPTPARVTTLLGSERDYYLKGRRAESQSMGVAAFAYYRRVVENKKAEIIDEVIRVSKLLNADAALLAELEQAKSEIQFTKAVEAVKHGIPQVLFINGHNPLTLLHAALSEGLHAQTDEECLQLAASIRVVLTEFVERVTLALKEEKELVGAVSRLMQIKNKAQVAK